MVVVKKSFPAVATVLAILSTHQIHADDSAVASKTLADFEFEGSCTFNNPWSGPSCMEFRGDGWNDNTAATNTVDGVRMTMTERCAEEADSTLVEGGSEGCPTPPELAGWCVTTAVEEADVQTNDGATTTKYTTKVEASSMMVSDMADCSGNKMACETFVGGTWEAAAGCNSEANDDPSASIEMNMNAAAACDESLTSPVILSCPDPEALMVSYDGSVIDCGAVVSLSKSAMIPTVQVVDVDAIDAEALYTLVLVDTTANPEGSSFGVHPILHYGAVNIPGSALLRGIFLDSNDQESINVFSDYRGPSPPSPEDPWSTPETQKTLFVYEYMLVAQPKAMDLSQLLANISSNMRFDYENFFVETIGSPFENVMSTYFQSGRCVGVETSEDSSTMKTGDIVIESFDDPKFLWESFTMDEDKMEQAQQMEDQYDYDFSNYTNEFQDGSYNSQYGTTKGSSMEIVDGIMILTANISSADYNMGGGSMSGNGGMATMATMVTMAARGIFPDLHKCDGIKFEVMTAPPDAGGIGNATAYDGYKVDIGYDKLPDRVFGYGYRANLMVPIIDSSDMSVSTVRQSPSFMNVTIPFDDFTLNWDWNSGKQITSCIDDVTYCPNQATLENLETITISAVGTTNGVVQLHIKSIHGTGCDMDAINMDDASNIDNTMDADDSQDTNNSEQGEDQWTCGSSTDSAATSDEIIIESFSNPLFNWVTQNDPVMGGKSTSSIAMMESDGTAIFTGEVKDVPFLGVPGFIQMEARGGEGTYPDVSCCDSLKLTVMGMQEYAGYRVSFGTKRAKTGFFAQGFKADVDVPTIGQYVDVVIPFNMFSVEWDEATGDQKITCAEDPSVCPDMETLENMKTVAIWGEGVGGEINLHVKSISAVGCSSSSSSPPDSTSLSSGGVESLSSNASKSGLSSTMLMGFVAALTSTFFMLF